MTFGSILYQLFISPITLLLEVVFALFFSVLNSCGAAIFPLSLVVNLLLLPFYNRADSIQDEERRRQEKMAPFVEHIKKTFKGDERYMMLQSFYRENGYKPSMHSAAPSRWCWRSRFLLQPTIFFQIFRHSAAQGFSSCRTSASRIRSSRSTAFPSMFFRS